MTNDTQIETISFLRRSAFSDGDPPGVVTIETHISIVLMSGDQAVKLKRSVRLPYVDFSTPERRLAACERELTLNRRTAPGLYRAVRRITREPDGSLAFDGGGPLVDAVVEMRRFDQDSLFDRMAVEGRLNPGLMTRLARSIATFHAGIEPDRSGDGADRMAAVLDINASALATTDIFPPSEVAAFNRRFRERLAGLAALLDDRARAGRVRRCHGDLHLRNICLVEGEPTLFDCLEFDETLATTDVLYDLAFLLMDLWHRGLEGLANLVLNRYLDETSDEAGLPLLPFLMAVRAAVRAHVSATQAAGTDASSTLSAEARAYFDLALALLQPVPARLVAVGGLSGSGKSTVAAALAPALGPPPGARILASDRIRKRLFEVSAETRLPDTAYRPEVSDEVYAALCERAGAILRAGHAVVADAVFDRPDERRRIAQAAGASPFLGLWLDVAPERLVRRVAERRGDVSDATPAVVEAQLERFQGPTGWTRVAADGDASAVCATAARIVAGSKAGA